MNINTKSIPPPTFFGKNLRLLRRLKGVSQQELANNVGLSRNNIASYESGTVEPNAMAFLKIAHYLEIDPILFLSTEIASDKLNSMIEINHKDSTISEFLSEHLTSFINSTTESSKILEAYRSFYELSDLNDLPIESEIGHLRNQILELFQKLLDANWEFIQHISTTKKE